jgi:hypothetical protein
MILQAMLCMEADIRSQIICMWVPRLMMMMMMVVVVVVMMMMALCPIPSYCRNTVRILSGEMGREAAANAAEQPAED